jgi:hypothetical protein
MSWALLRGFKRFGHKLRPAYELIHELKTNITTVKITPKNPHIPNFFTIGQTVQCMKTTSGLQQNNAITGSDIKSQQS